jgi:predicted PurR-regulated permease PerM
VKEPSKPAAEKVENAPPPAATTPTGGPIGSGAAGGPPVEPARRRLAHHLPRAGLILFVLAMLVIFRGVLLPFVLGVFFAYLIYPVVWRLERIPLGRRRMPRWLSVISVYAVLFFVGWWTIPPLLGNFAEQVGKLLHDVPTLFERVLEQRKKLDRTVASMLEVHSISEAARIGIFVDVDGLATGRLEPFVPPEGIELPPPPDPAPAKPAAGGAVAPPTVVQIFGVNVTFTPAPPAKPDAEAGAPGATRKPAPAPIDPVPPDQEPPPHESLAPGTPLPRFAPEQANALKFALRDAINAELDRPGPARDVPLRVEREIAPSLVAKDTGLPADDPQVRLFARNCSARVAAAVNRENLASSINAYFVATVNSARNWVQEELKQVAELATGLIAGLVRGIFDFFMVLMLTALFLVFFPRIRDYGRDLVAPAYREDYAIVLKRIDTRLSGAIRGQVIICMVNALLTFPGLWFIGAHTDATNLAVYAVLLSVIAGVLSMIPIFGVIFSTVPMVILALAQGSIWGSVLVIGWICVIHAIEAYLLNPNILGHSASINPIVVVFALLAGKQLYGLVGALLAVPVASVLVSLFGYYRRLVTESVAAEQGHAPPADSWGD